MITGHRRDPADFGFQFEVGLKDVGILGARRE